MPPFGIIHLDAGCHASNNFLSLPPYYGFEEYDDLIKIHNTTDFRIWEPFSKALPKFTRLELPRNLSTVRQIPMEDLIFRLRGMRNIEIPGHCGHILSLTVSFAS